MRKFTDYETSFIKSYHHKCVSGETFKRTDRLYVKNAIAVIPGKFCSGACGYVSDATYELRIEPVEGGLHFYLGGHIPEAADCRFTIRTGVILDYTVKYDDLTCVCWPRNDEPMTVQDVSRRAISNFFATTYRIISGYGWLIDAMADFKGNTPDTFGKWNKDVTDFIVD